jgi:hypothetical protein
MNFIKLVLSFVLFTSSRFFILVIWKVELCLVKDDHDSNSWFLFAFGNNRCNVFYPAVGVPSLDTAYQVAVVAMVVMHPLHKAVGK